MSRGWWTLGRVRAAPIRVHWTVLLGALLWSHFQILPAFWLGFALLILIHELGHALVVVRYGLGLSEIAIHGAGGYCRHERTGSRFQEAVIASGGVLAQLTLYALVQVALLLFGPPTSTPVGLIVYVFTSVNLWLDAYLDGPQQNHIERAELTFFPGTYVSYKLGYIDGIGLPMELQAIGPGADCNKAVACYATQAQITAQCPDGLLSGKRCLSAGEYCKDAANAAKPYCHALDAAIAQCAVTVPGCADTAGATTAEAYRCDRSFGDKPKLCAAINRGMLADPNSSTESAFYGAAPHNTYAAWLHAICPGLAAFPYDDANLPADSFHTCIDPDGGTQLNITFCPAG